MSDRFALAHAIEDAGIPREKAENVASVIVRVIEGSVATKAQLDAAKAELKADIQASNADIARAESALKAEIGRVEMILKGDIAAVRTDITRLDGKVELVGSRTFNRLGALVAGGVAIIVALQHFWPPH